MKKIQKGENNKEENPVSVVPGLPFVGSIKKKGMQERQERKRKKGLS